MKNLSVIVAIALKDILQGRTGKIEGNTRLERLESRKKIKKDRLRVVLSIFIDIIIRFF